MSRHYSSTTVCTRYLRVSLLVVLVLIALPGIVSAQGGDNPEIEAQRHIELAQAYEDAGLWEEAEAEYRAVLSLSDSTHVPAAQAGLARVLRARTSFWVGLVVEIRRFLLWLISGASKVLIVGGMAYLVLKVVSPRLMRSTDCVAILG
jgi:hypothetical protein